MLKEKVSSFAGSVAVQILEVRDISVPVYKASSDVTAGDDIEPEENPYLKGSEEKKPTKSNHVRMAKILVTDG